MPPQTEQHVQVSPRPATFGIALALDEVVIASTRPGLWFIVLHSSRLLGWVLAIWLLTTAAHRFGLDRGLINWPACTIGLLLLAGTVLIWKSIDRMARCYILTDRRMISVRGVFSRLTLDVPLTSIHAVALNRTLGERVLGMGSIAVVTAIDQVPGGRSGSLWWLALDQPGEVLARIREAMNARQRKTTEVQA